MWRDSFAVEEFVIEFHLCSGLFGLSGGGLDVLEEPEALVCLLSYSLFSESTFDAAFLKGARRGADLASGDLLRILDRLSFLSFSDEDLSIGTHAVERLSGGCALASDALVEVKELISLSVFLSSLHTNSAAAFLKAAR